MFVRTRDPIVQHPEQLSPCASSFLKFSWYRASCPVPCKASSLLKFSRGNNPCFKPAVVEAYSIRPACDKTQPGHPDMWHLEENNFAVLFIHPLFEWKFCPDTLLLNIIVYSIILTYKLRNFHLKHQIVYYSNAQQLNCKLKWKVSSFWKAQNMKYICMR